MKRPTIYVVTTTLVRRMRSVGIQLLIGWGLLSCLTPIDIGIDSTANKIVISGQVSTIPDRSFAHVATTTAPNRLAVGMQGAIVDLVEEDGTLHRFTEIIDQRNPGNYVLNGFTATPGRWYFVRVRTPNALLESAPERVPMQTGTDELSYEFTEATQIDEEGTPFNKRMIRIFSQPSIPESDEPIFIKWDLQEVYLIVPTDFPDPFGRVPPPCYVTQAADPQRIVLYDGSLFSGNASNRVFLGWRQTGQTFQTRHYFVSYMSSITQPAHDYWKKVNTLANQVGSIFDSPPSPVTGNIYNAENPNEAMLGYFQAVNESVTRTYILKSDLPFFLEPYCTYNPDWAISRYSNECLDCIGARNSSYVRPVWFGE
jgi:hypothetical protein